MGETEEGEGFETTVANMGKLQNVLTLLGMNVKLCPKLSSRYLEKNVPSGAIIIKEEVLELEDTPGYVDQVTKQKYTAAKDSSSIGAFRQTRLLKEFKKNMVRALTGDKENQKDEIESSCSMKALEQKTINTTEEESSTVKFWQSGLLQDFKVNLVQCTDNGRIRKEGPVLKNSMSEGERSFMCNVCGVEFVKYDNLRRHCREKHGIQYEKPSREEIKPSVIRCPMCGMKFRFRGSLLRHFRRVHKETHSEKELQFKCEVCDKKYVHLRNLQRHKQVQHFKMKVELNHQEDTSVIYKDCGLVNANIEAYNQHRQEVHMSKDESKASAKIPVIPSKKTKCSDCEKTFEKSSSLWKHKERFHRGKTYGCGECGHICAYKYSMESHCTIKGHDKDLIHVIVDLPVP